MRTSKTSGKASKVSAEQSTKNKKQNPFSPEIIAIITIAVIVLRLLINTLPSYKVDIGVYKWWGYTLQDKKFNQFYGFSMEAEKFSNQSGLTTLKTNDGLSITDIDAGDWLEFKNVDFKEGFSAFSARLSSLTKGNKIEVVLDDLKSGTVAGTLDVDRTGSLENWSTQTLGMTEVKGVHNVYLKFSGTGSSLFNLNWIDFGNNSNCIYGPGYLYLVWFVKGFADLVTLGETTPNPKIIPPFSLFFGTYDEMYEYFIKFASVLFDLLGAVFIYLIGRKYDKERTGFIVSVFYALNPAVFFDSSIWAQFDTIQASLLIMVVYFFNIKKLFPAILIFSIAILTKPQSIMLAAAVAFLFFKHIPWKKLMSKEITLLEFLKTFSIKTGLTLVTGFGTYIVMVLPFFAPKPSSSGSPVNWLIDFFTYIPRIILNGSDAYPYATANAFNVWTLLGGQTINDKQPFWGLTYVAWSNIFLLVVIGLTMFLLIKKSNSVLSLYYASFFLYFGTFMFWSKMHERYLLPCLIFATVCILWDRKMWVPTVLLSIFCFLNQYYLYQMSFKNQYWVAREDNFANTVAFLSLGVMGYAIYYLFKLALRKNKKDAGEKLLTNKS
ncbi:MAG: carbohydrate-binding protein [Clostridia bacterium]|nr:carbohydrate-binding protein [Clostridia bacterium]